MVDSAVMVTDSAKLDRDKKTITLDAVPPGQLDTKISPTAKKGSRSKAFPKSHPKKGMTVNCKNKPVIIHLGVWVTRRKSSNLSVNPIPNIIPPKPRVIKFLENHVKIGGWYNAKQEADSIIQGKADGI